MNNVIHSACCSYVVLPLHRRVACVFFDRRFWSPYKSIRPPCWAYGSAANGPAAIFWLQKTDDKHFGQRALVAQSLEATSPLSFKYACWYGELLNNVFKSLHSLSSYYSQPIPELRHHGQRGCFDIRSSSFGSRFVGTLTRLLRPFESLEATRLLRMI